MTLKKYIERFVHMQKNFIYSISIYFIYTDIFLAPKNNRVKY